MDKYIIEKIVKEHKGRKHEFLFGVVGENIRKAGDATIVFEDAGGETELPESGQKLGVMLGKIRRCLTGIKENAFSGKYEDLQNRPDLTKKMNVDAVRQVTVREFSNEMTGSVSLVKFGKMVIVTAAVSTKKVIEHETVLFKDNTIIPEFGIPAHDFTCAMTGSIDERPLDRVGTMSVHPDTGLRVALPNIGQYDCTFIYCVK